MDGDILPGDQGCAMFLEVIIDPEKKHLFETAQLIRLPASQLTIKKDSWLDDNIVLLDQEGSIALASDVESSSKDEFHI